MTGVMANPGKPGNRQVSKHPDKFGDDKSGRPPKSGTAALCRSLSEDRRHFRSKQSSMGRRIQVQQ